MSSINTITNKFRYDLKISFIKLIKATGALVSLKDNQKLIMPIPALESCLGNILSPNLQLMIFRPQVNHRED